MERKFITIWQSKTEKQCVHDIRSEDLSQEYVKLACNLQRLLHLYHKHRIYTCKLSKYLQILLGITRL